MCVCYVCTYVAICIIIRTTYDVVWKYNTSNEGQEVNTAQQKCNMVNNDINLFT